MDFQRRSILDLRDPMEEYGPCKDVRVLVNERVMMRDRVHLATTVFLPIEGDSFPVVLVRTAYNRAGLSYAAMEFVNRGIAFIVQDTRGRYGSEGHFYPFYHDSKHPSHIVLPLIPRSEVVK